MISLTDAERIHLAVALSNYGDVSVHNRHRMDELLDLVEKLEVHPSLLFKGLKRASEARERRNVKLAAAEAAAVEVHS